MQRETGSGEEYIIGYNTLLYDIIEYYDIIYSFLGDTLYPND